MLIWLKKRTIKIKIRRLILFVVISLVNYTLEDCCSDEWAKNRDLGEMLKDPSKTNKYGRNILHYAVACGASAEEIKDYILRGARVNEQDKSSDCGVNIFGSPLGYHFRDNRFRGGTPLYFAAWHYVADVGIISMLLAYGADPELKTDCGKTPSDCYEPFISTYDKHRKAYNMLQEVISRWDEKKGWIKGCVQISRSEELE
jgi:hypothetical protein